MSIYLSVGYCVCVDEGLGDKKFLGTRAYNMGKTEKIYMKVWETKKKFRNKSTY